MRLTQAEERMLNGEEGYIKKKAMTFLVRYGEAAGAERLIDLDGTADFHPGLYASWFPETAITLDEIKELAARGERFKVPTFGNKPGSPAFIVHGWEDCGVWPQNDPDCHAEYLARMKPYMQMGMIPALSCDYYLISSFLPTAGQHCAWGESSAIPWVNAILGARANYDGCFEAAYLGKIPAYDMHLDENRKPTRLVECQVELKTDMDYDLFGWAVGEKIGVEVPVITGIGKPTYSQLVKMNSTLNTGGQVRMYHVPGLTPEAPHPGEVAAMKFKEKYSIDRNDLKKVYEKINYASKRSVDFVYLGCPHYNIIEIQKVVSLLKGRKVRVPMWVMTNPWTFKMAEQMGYRDTLVQAGAALLSGTCPGMMEGCMPPADVIATDSAKQNYYITGFIDPRPLQAWYGSVEDCVEAAVTGKWEGQWS